MSPPTNDGLVLADCFRFYPLGSRFVAGFYLDMAIYPGNYCFVDDTLPEGGSIEKRFELDCFDCEMLKFLSSLIIALYTVLSSG